MATPAPIGYIYQADLYCPTCIVDAAVLYPSVGGLDPRDTEDRLDFCAGELGIDRSDERSFDSSDFPKVYAGTPHDGCCSANGYEPGQCGDRCATCGEYLGHECPNVADAVDLHQLAEEIDALDFDTVFRIEDGVVVIVDDVYAPEVYFDAEEDVTIEGDGDWHCLTGMTRQYSYSGAVMHGSEHVGSGIAEILAEDDPGTLFAIVVVNVLPGDCEDHDDCGEDGCEPAGWAIAYRSAD